MSTSGPTKIVETTKRGRELLADPLLNKDSAFTASERHDLGLELLLPAKIETISAQVNRAHQAICRKEEPLERYIGLQSLLDRNEILFYRLLAEHIETYLPIVYTPTVGEGCRLFSQIIRKPRGLWIRPEHKGRLPELLARATVGRDIRLIVVTDGERILGLGDLGAGGIGISIGKLSLYTVGAGIHPSQTLPVCIDLGTDTAELRDDPLYLGRSEPRLRGEQALALVDELVEAIAEVLPNALLQWEDLKQGNAIELLARYRNRLASFNDDIQGTAAVGLAGVLAGSRSLGSSIAEARVLFYGAGAAGWGIAMQISGAMQRAGLSKAQASGRLAAMDSRGLLLEGRDLRPADAYKADLLLDPSLVDLDEDGRRDLVAVIRAFRPTVLIGTSGQAGAFDDAVVKAMAEVCERPMIFPFSNPTSNSEGRPEEILRATGGRALVATGSPFAPVELDGKTYRTGQGNNVFIFPGVGLGILACGAREVSDTLFTVAAETLAAALEPSDLAEGALYPHLDRLASISGDIAVAVARQAIAEGHAEPLDDEALSSRIAALRWQPSYPAIRAI